MNTQNKNCTCGFSQETAREIGHKLNCPRKDDKTWWEEKEHAKETITNRKNEITP